MWSTIGRTLGVASVRAAAVAPSVSATPRALVSVLGPCSSSLRTSYIQAAVAQGFVVRRAYAAAAAATSARARKPAAKKTAARKPAAKKTAARKPAAKKKATAKKPTKKAAGRTKPTAAAKKRAAAAKKRATAAKKRAAAAKKKKAAKKAAPKKKKESPEKREHRRKMLLYRKLREHALVGEPKYLPENLFMVFSGEMRQNPENKNKTILEWAKEVGKAYNELSEEKKNRLRGLAAANAATNALAHKRWVESYSPLQILTANRARAILKRRFPGRLRKKLHAAIKDERLPPRPRSPWVQYIISRHQNKTAPESDKSNLGSTFKTMAVDWKALSSAERKPFEDLTAAEIVKYQAFAKDVKL